MIAIRRSDDRGHFDYGWLKTFHTFSFGRYHDPRFMGFRSLRVINEDRVQPGRGFGAHGHDNMEILSYVLEGKLAHRDSMGTGATIGPGEMQYMSAGSGITHSEFNASDEQPVHFLQIWIEPREQDAPPRYDQRAFPVGTTNGTLLLVASASGREGSIAIRQDADVFLARLAAGEHIAFPLRAGRGAWLHLIQGEATLNGATLSTGDGAACEGESPLHLAAGNSGAHLLLFDLA